MPFEALGKLDIFPATRQRRADVYRQDRVPGFTLAYVVYPVGDFVVTMQNERLVKISFKAWDKAGRPIPMPTP